MKFADMPRAQAEIQARAWGDAAYPSDPVKAADHSKRARAVWEAIKAARSRYEALESPAGLVKSREKPTRAKPGKPLE